MRKSQRAMRLSDADWERLGKLADRSQTDRTKYIENFIRREYEKMQSQNEEVLAAYHIGDEIQLEHPATEEEEAATITAFTAGEFGRLDGVMVRFADGVFFQVAAKYLEKKIN